MRNTVFFLLAVISLNACHKSSNNPTDTIYKFDSIPRVNLTGLTNMTTGTGPTYPETFYYKYIGDKFSIRIGGFANFSYSGGYYSVFTPLRYDTVIYDAGSVRVVARSTGYGVLFGEVDTTLFAVSNNKLQTRIYYDPVVQSYDTTFFYYSANQKLTRTVENFDGTAYEKIYDYSSSGNLETILGTISANSDGSLLYTSKETFGNYDSTRNPLKDYWLWDESFLRSLSENNFRSYQYVKVYARPGLLYTGTIVDSLNQTWNFQYRNGLVDYSK
jgi:hypothetical protein